MYISGHNHRNRYKSQQGLNGNHQRTQMRQNLKPQKANHQSDSEQSAILQGIDKLSELFKKEMGDMSSRMSIMEMKNELVLQQNRNLAENVELHRESAIAWKAKAEERMEKYKQALAKVVKLIENNNELRDQNDALQRSRIDFDERMRILIDRNKIFENGIKVLITEHADLRNDLMKLAEKSAIADNFQSLIEEDGYDEDEDRARDRRATIKAAMVLAYVASNTKQ